MLPGERDSEDNDELPAKCSKRGESCGLDGHLPLSLSGVHRSGPALPSKTAATRGGGSERRLGARGRLLALAAFAPSASGELLKTPGLLERFGVGGAAPWALLGLLAACGAERARPDPSVIPGLLPSGTAAIAAPATETSEEGSGPAAVGTSPRELVGGWLLFVAVFALASRRATQQ